jgi:hypothetical protein
LTFDGAFIRKTIVLVIVVVLGITGGTADAASIVQSTIFCRRHYSCLWLPCLSTIVKTRKEIQEEED